MNWLTKEQIAEAAKTREGAIKYSALHWYQFATCTKEEFIEGWNDKKVNNENDFCALCQLDKTNHDKCPHCNKCPLGLADKSCYDNNSKYQQVNAVITSFSKCVGGDIEYIKIDGRKFRKFQRLALEFSKFIGELK